MAIPAGIPIQATKPHNARGTPTARAIVSPKSTFSLVVAAGMEKSLYQNGSNQHLCYSQSRLQVVWL